MATSERGPVGYVVWWEEMLRDGRETGSKMFPNRDGKGLEKALEWINEIASGFGGDAHSFQVFEVGPEVKLVLKKGQKVLKPAQTLTVTKYEVKEDR